MPSSPRYATQADVARLAGVSRATVSLVVMGSPHVSPAKRERVLEAIDQLGYVHNALASTLAGNRRALTVGVLLQSLTNPVFTEIYEGLEEVLSPAGHQLIVMRGGVDLDEEDAALRTLTSLRPDGIILAGYAGSTQALYRALRAVPAVSVTREILPPQGTRAPRARVVSVSNDDYAGGRLATEHLLRLGHRRVTHLQVAVSLPYDGRSQAYTETMTSAGLVPRLVPAPIDVAGAREVALAELRGPHRPTAFFCGNDIQALGALDAVRQEGLVPGREVCVVGYDNTLLASRAGLTSVDQHARTQGILAARALLEALDVPAALGEKVRATSGTPTSVPPPRLVVRASSLPRQPEAADAAD